MLHNYDRQFNGIGLPEFVAVYAVLIVVFLFSTPVESIFVTFYFPNFSGLICQRFVGDDC